MASPASGNTAAVVRANNTFAFAMYKELLKTKGEKNLFFSPMSITAALAMVHLGAGGKTADEIKAALQVRIFKSDGEMSYISMRLYICRTSVSFNSYDMSWSACDIDLIVWPILCVPGYFQSHKNYDAYVQQK